MEPAHDKSEPDQKNSAQSWLGLGLPFAGVGAIVILGGIIIWNSDAVSEDSQMVLTVTLPMIGTWVGVVLAFYFGKDNLAAATRSVVDVAKQLTPAQQRDQLLQSAAASEKMISLNEMFRMEHSAALQKPLSEILKEIESDGKGDRLPILDTNNHAKLLIHRSKVDRYLSNVALDNPKPSENDIDITEITLGTMLENSKELKTLFENGFAFIAEGDTLLDAKKAMSRKETCQDVFITKTGRVNEPVIGWITNNIIQDNAKL